MKKYAVIVAGGSGTRMGSDTPKQFLPLGEKPILMHTIEVFAHTSSDIAIILVLPDTAMDAWQNLCHQHQFNLPHLLVAGGSSRFESVKNGLNKIGNPDSLVAIHDGVRPLVSRAIITRSYETAARYGSAIVVTPLKESIRQLQGEASIAIDRTRLRAVQTPQTFKTGLIQDAFSQFASDQNFTDDASVAEKAGIRVHLIEGSYQNIKITTPEDLLFAEAILEQKKGDK